jgi:glycosyltransferase involved in cell wall biosynthesis
VTQKPIVASYCSTFAKQEMLHVYRQITGLQRHRTFVITQELVNPDRFPFKEVETVGPGPDLDHFARVLRRRRAGLLHIYFGHMALPLQHLLADWETPWIVSFHGADVSVNPRHRGHQARLREVLQTATLVLARSKSLLARLRDLGCPPEKLRLNRTGIHLRDFAFQRRDLPIDGSWRLVQACRLIPKKGLGTTLRAFATFHARYPRSSLVIAGEGPLRRSVESLARDLGISKAVELPGFLSQNKLTDLLYRSHVFLHPSETQEDHDQEGIPNSMLEAMATGLPVVATRHGGIPEAVLHGESGLLVPERDEQGLARALCALVSSADHYHSMASAARTAVSLEFDAPQQIDNLERCYEEAARIAPPIVRNVMRPAPSQPSSLRRPRLFTMASPRQHGLVYLLDRWTEECRLDVEGLLTSGMRPLAVLLNREEETTHFEGAVRILPSSPSLQKFSEEIHVAAPEAVCNQHRPGHDNCPALLDRALVLGSLMRARNIRHVHSHGARDGGCLAHLIARMFGTAYSLTLLEEDLAPDGESVTRPIPLEEIISGARFVIVGSRENCLRCQSLFPRQRTMFHCIGPASPRNTRRFRRLLTSRGEAWPMLHVLRAMCQGVIIVRELRGRLGQLLRRDPQSSTLK